MNFNLTSDNARAVAARLQSSSGVSRSQAYEAIAQMLGHPNWDTLKGLLEKESRTPPAHPRLKKAVTLYVQAFTPLDFGVGAEWARVTIDQGFLDTVLRLQDICVSEALEHVTLGHSVDFWKEDENDPVSIRDESLYVNREQWWFRGRPKYADYAVETRSIDINDLMNALFQQQSTEHLAWQNDVLVYDSTGNIRGFLQQLVNDGELDEAYLPD